jgi:hypothetical protein
MEGITTLDELEITNLINYMNQNWNKGAKYLSLEATKRKLDNCN